MIILNDITKLSKFKKIKKTERTKLTFKKNLKCSFTMANFWQGCK